MRPALIVIFLVSTLAARPAIAADASHETAPPAPIAPLAPPAPDPGMLRCECTPLAPSEWHWSERRKIGLATIGFGVVSGTVGFAFAWSGHRSFDQATQGQGMAAAFAAEGSIRDRETAANLLIGAAGLSALVGAALVLWPESHRVSVAVMASGGALVMCGGAF